MRYIRSSTVYCDRVYSDDKFTVYLTIMVWVYRSGTVSLCTRADIHKKTGGIGRGNSTSKSIKTEIIFV